MKIILILKKIHEAKVMSFGKFTSIGKVMNIGIVVSIAKGHKIFQSL